MLLLARRKAEDVARRLHAEEPDFDGFVIGGDSMFALGDEILGKPYTPEAATARWLDMRGAHRRAALRSQRVRLSPGSAAARGARRGGGLGDLRRRRRRGRDRRYVASGEPLLVAGAFTVDSLGGAFIERVEGDPSTVVGMSLSTVRGLVRELGGSWTALWNRS